MEYIRACHSYDSFGKGKGSTKFLIRQIFLKKPPDFYSSGGKQKTKNYTNKN